MQYESMFSVRYLTDDPVPIRDIISSLQAVEKTLHETARLLPVFVDGISVEKLEVRVREVAQESPLRELFAISLFLAFQKDLEQEVPNIVSDVTGLAIPDRFDTTVTLIALTVVFYGVGALKDLVFGAGVTGEAKVQLDGLIKELSLALGKPEKFIRERLAERYSEKPKWRRIANNASRFFAPSKRQGSAAVEVNGRQIPQQVVRDVPAEFLVDNASDENPTRTFNGVLIELHAQDRDHTGRGWAAVVDGVSEQRLRMKLMDDVSASDLWNRNRVRGDVVVLYEKVGGELNPKEIHLLTITGMD